MRLEKEGGPGLRGAPVRHEGILSLPKFAMHLATLKKKHGGCLGGLVG